MLNLFSTKVSLLKETGWLAVITALLLELILALWIIFLALFSLETLLPTFVTIRVSLTSFLSLLILLTTLYLVLEQHLTLPLVQTKTPRLMSWGVSLFGFTLILLSLARFPLLAGGFFLVLYMLLWWYLKQGKVSSTHQN